MLTFLVATLAMPAMPPLAQEQRSVVYTDDELGLSFRHPASWQMEEREYSVDFTIPLGGERTALLRLLRSRYRFEKANWQELQKSTNELGENTVVRQWEEQLLGVPLLLTEVRLARDSGATSMIIGLLYTASEEKLLVRLESPTDAIREAESLWRQAMLSLRTTSGTLPEVENPNTVNNPPTTQQTAPPNTRQNVAIIGGSGNSEVTRGENALAFDREGTKLTLLAPSGWQVRSSDGTHILTHEASGLTVAMLVGVGGWQAGYEEWIRATSSDLARFESVALRKDREVGRTRAGATGRSVSRKGIASGSERTSWIAVAGEQDYWWLLRTEASAVTDAAQKALSDLLELSWVQRTE